MNVTVVLVDDHTIVRDGLRALLDKDDAMEVVGEAADGRSAVRLARDLSPDIVIMDVAMSDLNGIEATRQIVAEMPRVKVLALSMYSDRVFVSEMLKAGASGYLLKDCAFDELTHAIGTVMAHRIYLSPGISDVVVADYLERLSKDGDSVSSVLSSREREVLQLLAEGKTTKDIAGKLHVSSKTIDTHRQQIMAKLGVHSIAELTKYAISQGLSALDI